MSHLSSGGTTYVAAGPRGHEYQSMGLGCHRVGSWSNCFFRNRSSWTCHGGQSPSGGFGRLGGCLKVTGNSGGHTYRRPLQSAGATNFLN